MKFEKGETILMEFDLYYSGWECDSEAWVVENEKGERYCVGTNHGGRYTMPIEELTDFIDTYKYAIQETYKAIGLLKGEF